MRTETINSLDDLQAFASRFADTLKGGDIVGLVGDLGAGKTTLTQMLAKELGVKAAVKSPTFILMQVLDIAPTQAKKRGFKRICHVDAYRLKDYPELQAVGFEEYAGEKDVVTIVEWSDRVPELHQKHAHFKELTFAFGKEQKRLIRYE